MRNKHFDEILTKGAKDRVASDAEAENSRW